MPLYIVAIIATLEVRAAFAIDAEDQADADNQAAHLADRVAIGWTVVDTPGPALAWTEVDQTAVVDAVEEVE